MQPMQYMPVSSGRSISRPIYSSVGDLNTNMMGSSMNFVPMSSNMNMMGSNMNIMGSSMMGGKMMNGGGMQMMQMPMDNMASGGGMMQRAGNGTSNQIMRRGGMQNGGTNIFA